jgi:hypothetical protein
MGLMRKLGIFFVCGSIILKYVLDIRLKFIIKPAATNRKIELHAQYP